MTPRQQEAYILRRQGLTQHEIGAVMNISQSRVSTLLSLNAGQNRWAKANSEKVKAMTRLRYAANPEKFREVKLRYYRTEKGREAHHRYKLKYYQANRKELLAKNAAYQKSPSGRAVHNRAARKYAAAKRLSQKE